MSANQFGVSTMLKGAAMGIAEVIPGVSGGTIAFITGIYETLLLSIKAFGPDALNAFKTGGIKGLAAEVNLVFLLTLAAGMAGGMIVSVFGVTYILEHFPLLLWSFFFGLIIASAIYVGKQVSKWNIVNILLLIGGLVISYVITISAPATGSESLLFVFLAGIIAISALMLPGLSGSFMLLLMGMYTIVIPAVKSVLKFNFDKLVLVIVFAAGCGVGLITFSRVLSWTFKNYRNQTLALLTGFMIGSLNKVWPWQHVLSTRINSDGEQVIAFTKSVLPNTFSALGENLMYGNNPQVLFCILFMVFGFAIVFVIEKLAGENPEAA